ncbi:MAG: 2-C-methyl-D-erythritol 4-phosphate cytidylyltransferase [bacterium]|nr:2-C-methyl-D-erythritol 4-phosphate cytidylyltransferase [bacterium]
MSYALLIPAAGRGERLGESIPKALVQISGKPLIWWAVNAFANDDRLSEIVIATSAEIENDIADSFRGQVFESRIRLTRGGATRQDSVGNALAVVSSNVDSVLVHDAARPLLKRLVIDNVLDGLAENVASVPGVAITDTIKRVESNMIVRDTLKREELFAVQTPQGVRIDEFRKAHELARKHNVQCTDDVALIEHFQLGTVKLVPGDPNNLKVTHPHELPRAEALLRGTELP